MLPPIEETASKKVARNKLRNEDMAAKIYESGTMYPGRRGQDFFGILHRCGNPYCFSHRNGRVDLVGRTGLPWENLSIKNRPLWNTTHANGHFRFLWSVFAARKHRDRNSRISSRWQMSRRRGTRNIGIASVRTAYLLHSLHNLRIR